MQPGRNGGRLQVGNPKGIGPLPAAFAIRARHLLEKVQALDLAGRIIQSLEEEPRYITKDGTVVYTKPLNRDKLEALKVLAQIGRILPHEATPMVDNRQFLIVVPAKAGSTEEWLKKHGLGADDVSD